MAKFAARITLALFLLSTWTLAAEAPQRSNPALAEVIRTLFSAHEFDQTAISPDGRQVAWVERLVDKNGVPNGNAAIYVQPLNSGAAPRRVTAGNGTNAYAEQAIAWSPDSKQIAFLSDAAKPGQQQLYLIDVSGGSARRLTDVKGFLDMPGWSPDGKTLALLFTENATRAAGPLVAETAQTGVIQDAVTEQRLALVDAVGGKLHQISPADMYIYEYDWSPDGSSFVSLLLIQQYLPSGENVIQLGHLPTATRPNSVREATS